MIHLRACNKKNNDSSWSPHRISCSTSERHHNWRLKITASSKLFKTPFSSWYLPNEQTELLVADLGRELVNDLSLMMMRQLCLIQQGLWLLSSVGNRCHLSTAKILNRLHLTSPPQAMMKQHSIETCHCQTTTSWA